MELGFAFLADAATVPENGMFDVIGGGFDVLTGNQLPAIKHAMVLIGRIVFEAHECGKEYELHGEIVGPNGEIVPPHMRVSFVAPPHPRHKERPNWMTVCLNYQGVSFPMAGDYSFKLTVENQSIGEVTLEVVGRTS